MPPQEAFRFADISPSGHNVGQMARLKFDTSLTINQALNQPNHIL
jgi:hypothetical protein